MNVLYCWLYTTKIIILIEMFLYTLLVLVIWTYWGRIFSLSSHEFRARFVLIKRNVSPFESFLAYNATATYSHRKLIQLIAQPHEGLHFILPLWIVFSPADSFLQRASSRNISPNFESFQYGDQFTPVDKTKFSCTIT